MSTQNPSLFFFFLCVCVWLLSSVIITTRFHYSLVSKKSFGELIVSWANICFSLQVFESLGKVEAKSFEAFE
jgi:hypothetical protein